MTTRGKFFYKLHLTPAEQRLVDLARHWPWFLLGLATLVFVARYIPGFFFYSMDTETIVMPLFYHDIVVEHHQISNWGWGGFSAIFPDITLFFILNFLFRDGQLSLQLYLICLFIGLLAASVALGLVLKRPHKLALVSILLLFWVGMICNFAFPAEWALDIATPLVTPVYHSGAGLLTLICLVLLLRQITGGRWSGHVWLFVLIFLGGISDVLFVIDYAIPALATVVVLIAIFPRQWKNYLGLALSQGIAGTAAYFLGPYCFPAPVATAEYVQVNLDGLHLSYSSLLGALPRSEHHFFVFVFVLDVLTILGGTIGFFYICFSSLRKKVSPMVPALMVFCSSAVFSNWAGVLFTGDYQQGMAANRYLTVALAIPLFLFVFGLHAIILWRPWLEKLTAAAISAFTLAVAFIPQTPSINYGVTRDDIPYLKKVMAENHITAGLANYWSANIVTFLSNGKVPLRSLTSDGLIYRWFNSLEWFGKGHPVREWPHFRLIYIPDHQYSQEFGQPDQILYTPDHSEIWVYSEARSILYSEYFDVLSNSYLDDGRTLRIDASNLPTELGKIKDHSLIAIDGQEGEGWLDYGPYIILKPARYRATFHYTYLKVPLPDKFPRYDLLKHTGDHEQTYDGASLPCPNLKPQVFTDDFTVTEPNHKYEMRIFYHGSGTLRVDSLDISYIGP